LKCLHALEDHFSKTVMAFTFDSLDEFIRDKTYPSMAETSYLLLEQKLAIISSRLTLVENELALLKSQKNENINVGDSSKTNEDEQVNDMKYLVAKQISINMENARVWLYRSPRFIECVTKAYENIKVGGQQKEEETFQSYFERFNPAQKILVEMLKIFIRSKTEDNDQLKIAVDMLQLPRISNQWSQVPSLLEPWVKKMISGDHTLGQAFTKMGIRYTPETHCFIVIQMTAHDEMWNLLKKCKVHFCSWDRAVIAAKGELSEPEFLKEFWKQWTCSTISSEFEFTTVLKIINYTGNTKPSIVVED
jgi:hypothetical protein